LVLAAADEHRLSLKRESVKLGDLLEEVAERGRGRAQLQGRTITVDSDETAISADRQRLEYALGNLMDNALTHGAGTWNSSVAATVTLSSCTFVIMALDSPTAIWPIRSCASPRLRALGGALA
jgi:signal transduction histidine kinase